MKQWRPIARIALWVFAGVAGLAAAAVVAAILVLNTETGARRVAGLVSSAATSPNSAVHLGAIRLYGLRRIEIRDVGLSDQAGQWAHLDRLALTWHPLGLLRRRVDLGIVRAENVTVARRPLPNPNPQRKQPGGFELPRLPTAIRIEQIAVAPIVLEAPVLGERMALRLEGSVGLHTDQAILTHATLIRTDRPSRIVLDAAYRPRQASLDVTLGIEEPAGGLIGRLAKLPGTPAIAVNLVGSGPLDAWHATLQADLINLAEVSGELSGDLRPPGRFGGHFAAQFGPLMPDKIVQSLGNRADLVLDAATQADGTIRLTRLTLDTPNIGLAANGTVNRAANRIDGLDLTLSVPDGAPLQPVLGKAALGSAKLTAHLQGPLDGPRTRLDLAAERVAVPGLGRFAGLTAHADLVAPIGPDAPAEIPLRLSAKATGPTLDQAALDPLLGEAIDLDAQAAWNRKANRIALDKLDLRGAFVALTARGAYAVADNSLDAQAKLSVDRLRAAAPGASGRATAELTVKGALGGDLTAALAAKAEDLAYPAVPAVALFGSHPSIDAQVARAADGAIRIGRLEVKGAHIGLYGSDCTVADTVACRIEGRLDMLAPLSRPGTPLAGSVALDLSAQGPRADPELSLSVAARDGRFGAIEFRTVDARMQVRDPAGDANGALNVTFDNATGSARLTTKFAAADRRSVLRVSDLTLTAPGLDAAADLTIRPATKRAQGTIDLRLADAKRLAAMLGREAEGRATAHIALRDAGGKQSAEATVSAQSLRVRTGPNQVYRLASADLKAQGRDLLGAGASLTADLRGAGFAGAGIDLDTFSAAADGPLRRLNLRAAIDGRVEQPTGARPVALSLAALVDRSAQPLAIRLDRLGGKALGHDLALRRPARILLGQSATEIQGLDLGIDQGGITLSARFGKDAIGADLALRALPASLFAAIRPDFDFEGRIDGTASVQGRPGGGQGRVALRFAGLRTKSLPNRPERAQDLPTLSGRIDGTWNGRRAVATARIAGLSQTDVSLRADVPLAAPADSAVPALVRTAPLSAHLDWQGPVGPLWAFVPLVEHRLTGNVAIVADVRGTAAAPQVSGTARLSGGRYEHLVWGTVLDRLTVDARMEANRSADVTVSGTDGGKGTLRGSARVMLATPDRPLDATIDLRNFTAVRRDDATASLDAHITANGPVKSARIAGQVTTRRVEALLTANLPPSVVTLDVRQVNGPPRNPAQPPPAAPDAIVIRNTPAVLAQAAPTPQAAPEPPKTPPAAAMPLDIRVRLPHGVFVRGRGLDSEWKGNLRIGGTSAQPRIFGSLQLVRGDISLAGKTLDLDDTSTITFAGTTTIDPELNLTATITESNITATLTVTGRASQPKIALTSTPSLPQDEILAQMLFGKSTASLSPFEAVQLASAVADLTGITGSGPGLMGRMRTSLGLDVLRLQSNEEGQTTVGAGKYVGKRVYIGVQQGMQAASGQVTVNIDVTKHLSVETDIGAASNSRAGVNWKYDY